MFRKLFGRGDGEPPRQEPTPDPFGALRWLDPGENPYGVRMLDCRSFTREMVSTTGDPALAQKFVELRRSDGSEHRGARPPEPIEAVCELVYPAEGGSADGPLVRAEQMEDKWDVYLYDGVLYFARSWSGELACIAPVTFTDSEARITSVVVGRHLAGDIPALAVRQVDYLVKSHLYRLEVPHPLPASLPPEPKEIALYSFSLYGRWASFATYEETIGAWPEGEGSGS
jgi:hypothetical protein